MEDLQIPTRTVEVELLTDTGERLAGELFVPQTRYASGRPEDIIEVLNDERLFLPFRAGAKRRRASGRGPSRSPTDIVLNKDHIVSVRVGRTASPRRVAKQDPPPAPVVGPVTFWLSDGSRVSGEVAVETRWSSSRLVDKVNQDGRFVPVVSDGGLLFIQRAHVVRLA